tara:strand:- start:104 stop:664 length:561 start_codon:yes stop_codon:yes gene_type:complete
MYRAVTYFGQQQTTDGSIDIKLLIDSLPQISIDFELTKNGQQTFLNDENITDLIRQSKVNDKVSDVASIHEIRSFLVDIQKEMGSSKGVIMDGRDIGTIVFPEADYKFFLTASPKIRAQRRYEEQQKKGIIETLEEVLSNITARDHQDSTRIFTPLKKAKDAIEIDVSYMSIDDVFNVMIENIVES